MENIEIKTEIEFEIENDICLNGYHDLPLKIIIQISLPTMTYNKPKLLTEIAGV